jgi:UDP-N-acetylglucosamine transferase subunit ALG13
MNKICFTCSSGGHLNQLKELIDKVEYSECYFVTLKKSDAKSLLKEQKVYYVKDTKRNPINFIINIFQSLKIFIQNKPDVIISTGAGASLPTCYIAKLFGKKIILIESFARIEKPSLFGKIVYPIANLTILQWKSLQKYYPKGKYCGPIFEFKTNKIIPKKKQIFLTVGASHYNFDRLLKELDTIAPKFTKYEIIGQIGKTTYKPKNYQSHDFLSVTEINKIYSESEISICHAGTGSIVNSISNQCKTIVVPRYKKYNEHIDDHQLDITKKFVQKGLVLAAYDTKKLETILREIMTKKTKKFESKSQIPKIINNYLRQK